MGYRTGRLSLASVAYLLGMLLAPRVALACSCVGAPLADVSWPLDGATDVAIDTPIVVWLYGSDTSRESSLPTLVASDGVLVPLVETMRMTTPSDVCAASEHLFMRPARPLTPGVRYTIDFPAQAGPSLSPTPVTFQAGHEVFEPEPPVSADLQLLAVYRDPACTEPHCPQLNAARVDLGAPPARMLWLQFHSDAPKYGELNAQFIAQGRPGAQAAIQLPVALSPNDGCIDIRIVGVEGRPLLSERRCQPDRCAVSTRVSVSTCGGLPFSEIDAASVPVDSCKPTGVADAATAATGADAAASMSQNTPTPTAPSCAATHAGARQCSAWWSMLALGGLRRRLRRPTAKAVRDLASKRLLMLLDMTQLTHAYLERLGEMKATKLFNVNGTQLFFDIVWARLEPIGPAMRKKATLILLHGGPGFDHPIYRPAFDALADIFSRPTRRKIDANCCVREYRDRPDRP